MSKACSNCKRSYDINCENKVRCVFHNKYPKPTDCCDDWEERSGEMVNKDMAMQAIADAETILLAHVMIGRLPSVVPKPKEGEWILQDDEDSTFLVYRCSDCNEAGAFTNYCPNCGAKMKG